MFSAAIIAVIATLTWRWKRKRDLKLEEDKQHQQWRIAEEFEKKKRTEDVAALKRELEPLIDKFMSAAAAESGELSAKLRDCATQTPQLVCSFALASAGPMTVASSPANNPRTFL